MAQKSPLFTAPVFLESVVCNKRTFKLFIVSNKHVGRLMCQGLRREPVPSLNSAHGWNDPHDAPLSQITVLWGVPSLHGRNTSATRRCSFIVQFPTSWIFFSTTSSATFRPLFRCQFLARFPMIFNLKHLIILVRVCGIKMTLNT